MRVKGVIGSVSFLSLQMVKQLEKWVTHPGSSLILHAPVRNILCRRLSDSDKR